MDEGPGRRRRLQGPEDPERRREPAPGQAVGTGDADRGPWKLRRERVPGASGRELGWTPGWTPTQHESNVSREQDSARRAGLPEIGLLAPPRLCQAAEARVRGDGAQTAGGSGGRSSGAIGGRQETPQRLTLH